MFTSFLLKLENHLLYSTLNLKFHRCARKMLETLVKDVDSYLRFTRDFWEERGEVERWGLEKWAVICIDIG